MKLKILLIIVLFASALTVEAQKAFREVASKYSNYSSYFSSEINRKTLSLYLKEKKPADNVRAVLQTIDELKVLSFSITDASSVKGFISEVGKQYILSNYLPFRVVKKGPQNQLVYLKENGDQISELLLVSTTISKISLVEIKGNIDLAEIALLKNLFHFEGLESLSLINKKPENGSVGKENNETPQKALNSKHKNEPLKGEKIFPSKSSLTVYDKSGNQLIDSKFDPSLVVNGYEVHDDFKTTIADINPNCIQSIQVTKTNENQNSGTNQNRLVDIMLKGNQTDLYTICEGTLYFGQNGYLQSIKIDDDCSPTLLFNCKEKPLSELMRIEPKYIKSIALTNNPPNCNGPIEGEFIVVETK